MSANNREPCIKVTLGYEGGYTNNPSDPGGPTNWGITIADARHYWKPDATADDVKHMPLEVAVEIYRKRYWDALHCDDLPMGVDMVVFDLGVNSGVGRALSYLAKYNNPQDPIDTINRICDARLTFLKSLRTWPVFGKGWGARVVSVRQKALAMASSAAAPAPKPVSVPVPPPAPVVPPAAPTAPEAAPAAQPWWLTILTALLRAIFKKD